MNQALGIHRAPRYTLRRHSFSIHRVVDGLSLVHEFDDASIIFGETLLQQTLETPDTY
jgi:hypothetical protein